LEHGLDGMMENAMKERDEVGECSQDPIVPPDDKKRFRDSANGEKALEKKDFLIIRLAQLRFPFCRLCGLVRV
jgi:hypothetical protein